MKKGIAAAWIGASLVLATAMSLLRQTQVVVAAKPGIAATDAVKREPGRERQQIAAGEFEQGQEVEYTQVEVDEHVRRTALRSMSSATLPLPPLPSRVLPGPLSTPEQAAPEKQGDVLPMPPIPSKTLPGTIPEGGQNNSRNLDETEPIVPN